MCVNKEDTSTKTSVENMWKRPSSKKLRMYNIVVLFSEVYLPKPPYQKLARQPIQTAPRHHAPPRARNCLKPGLFGQGA